MAFDIALSERIMVRFFAVGLLLAIAGCSFTPRAIDTSSPCFVSEASYACQVERYQNVNAD